MENTISKLLGWYENGKMSRRELVAGLGLIMAGGRSVAAVSLKGIEFDHLSLQVRDLERSRDFYSKVLGLSVRSQGGPENTVTLRLGQGNSGHLTLRKGDPAPLVDHFAIRLESFDKPAVIEALRQQGVTPIDESIGAGFHVKDPDGFNVQLVAPR